MKEFHRFKLETYDDLKSDLAAIGADLPISSDFAVLGEKVLSERRTDASQPVHRSAHGRCGRRA